MKMLKDEVSLIGKVEQITLMDLRKQPGEVFASVELGKIFVITKSGKPIAIISRPPGETLTVTVEPNGEATYGT